MPLRVAILTAELREHEKDYGNPKPGFGTPLEALFVGFAQMPEVEVHVVSCTQEPLSSPRKLADNIFLHCLHVPKIGWMRTGYQGCIRAVRKKLREVQPDIVHGQGTERDCAINAVLSGFPNVLTIHGIMQEQARLLRSRPGSFHWLAARLEDFTLHRTAGVFCNSAYTEACIRPRTARTWRVANPLRAPFFESVPSVRKTVPLVLLNVGEICLRKRQNELIQSVLALREKGVPLELYFAGNVSPDKPYGAKFLELVKTHQSFVKYLGKKTTAELISLFDNVAALVHVPSEESFGLVVAEALTRNLKLFAFHVGGIPDIAAGLDGVDLIQDGEWDELNKAIVRWVQAGCYQPTAAARIMRERYHPRVIAQEHLDIYRQVLSKIAETKQSGKPA
jgi:glycosyltransferase involved in cell wall biosynthesis